MATVEQLRGLALEIVSMLDSIELLGGFSFLDAAVLGLWITIAWVLLGALLSGARD